MNTHPLFVPASADDIDRMIAAHPFALVISSDAGMPVATPLPLLLERHTDGSISLLGHIARATPHAQLLRRAPRAMVVFQGPHGYISPSWLADRTQAPTWNYETVQFDVEIEFDDRAEATDVALERLVEHMERIAPTPGRSPTWGRATPRWRKPWSPSAHASRRRARVSSSARTNAPTCMPTSSPAWRAPGSSRCWTRWSGLRDRDSPTAQIGSSIDFASSVKSFGPVSVMYQQSSMRMPNSPGM